MEAAPSSVAATRGVGSSLPMPSSRKEWRVVSEYQRHEHPVRNNGDEELQHSKMVQSDERTIYEHGRDAVDIDFGSINVDERLDNGMLQQRIQAISNRRQELLLLEVELRAQVITKTEISEMQTRFDSKMKEHADYSVKLQEQINEKDQIIHDLERRMEDKERELHAIKLDNEAAWAKEDIFREQNKELATFRREREHSEAERVQHIQQIQDLQERIQDKDRQIHDFQEQQRTTQETIFLKDEQLKAWISRVQELDALQLTTNQSLQAQLRERTEQYNQLWLGCQRQFVEMERLHLRTIQQIQLEISDARERGGSFSDELHGSDGNIKEVPNFLHSNGNPSEVEAHNQSNANIGVANAIVEHFPFAATGGLSSQGNHVTGVQIPPSSLLGVPTYLPHGQVTTMHPYALPQPPSGHSSQPSSGHFQHLPVPSTQQWQTHQFQQETSRTDQNFSSTEERYDYEVPVNGHKIRQMNVHVAHKPEPDSVIASSTEESQLNDSVDRNFLVSSSVDLGLQNISSQFVNSTKLNAVEQNEVKELNVSNLNGAKLDSQSISGEEPESDSSSSTLCDTSNHSLNVNVTTISDCGEVVVSQFLASTAHHPSVNVAKSPEVALLDEKALLSCIVRTIPPGGKIRITTTLPNRLGKMLAPLHWHDYKRQYGKLDDFVAGHPELFLVEGDFIQLRDGAQAMIAATAAVAKVAAAAAASVPHASYLPSVAVTPIAQPHRISRASFINSRHPNGSTFATNGGISNVKQFYKSQHGRATGGPLTTDTYGK